jgi:hypothetical protein
VINSKGFGKDRPGLKFWHLLILPLALKYKYRRLYFISLGSMTDNTFITRFLDRLNEVAFSTVSQTVKMERNKKLRG